ncbi:hypothetical protein LINGRAHAP2_LOCUS16863 [Linum grandiflorum]
MASLSSLVTVNPTSRNHVFPSSSNKTVPNRFLAQKTTTVKAAAAAVSSCKPYTQGSLPVPFPAYSIFSKAASQDAACGNDIKGDAAGVPFQIDIFGKALAGDDSFKQGGNNIEGDAGVPSFIEIFGKAAAGDDSFKQGGNNIEGDAGVPSFIEIFGKAAAGDDSFKQGGNNIEGDARLDIVHGIFGKAAAGDDSFKQGGNNIEGDAAGVPFQMDIFGKAAELKN